jgi:2-hydroxychromene-2-carboxylate isomerase
MEKTRVRIYTDYKSPYAFVANRRLFELEEKYDVELEWLPYTLRVAEFMGTVEERTPVFGARSATPIWTPVASPTPRASR